MVKQTNKLWNCVGSFTNKKTCTNSIVASNEDNRITKSGNTWVKLDWDKQKRYLPNKRYYLCNDCNNLNNNKTNEIGNKLITELLKGVNNG